MHNKSGSRKGLCSEEIARMVPWSEKLKVLVIYEDAFGSVCALASETAKDGYFLSVAELQASNFAVLHILRNQEPQDEAAV